MSDKTANPEESLTTLKQELGRILLYQTKARAYLEQDDAEVALNQARKTVEAISTQIYQNEGFEEGSKPVWKVSLEEIFDRFRREINNGNFFIPIVTMQLLETVRNLGNTGSHHQVGQSGIKLSTAKNCLGVLSEVVTWFCEEYYNVPLKEFEAGGTQLEEGKAESISAPSKKEEPERYSIRLRFWRGLLDHAKPLTSLHSNASPNKLSRLTDRCSQRGLFLRYSVRRNDTDVGLYIDRGKDSQGENKRILDQLRQNQKEIEGSFGDSLQWVSPDNQRACCIRRRFKGVGYLDEHKWNEVYGVMVDAMIRLEKSLRPFLDKIRI